MAPPVPHVVMARSAGTRIGEGQREGGALGDEPTRRTLDAVRSHLSEIRGRYVKLFVIATSAVRRAENAEAFAADIHGITGATLQILSGDEEAQASYRGAITVFGNLRGEEIGVADIGGGSTEYAIGSGPHSERRTSCEIGAVRLTEMVPALAGRNGAVAADEIERARGLARKALVELADFDKIEKLALVGGSATTTAAIVRGKKTSSEKYDVTRTDLTRLLSTLCGIDYEARKGIVGMKPQRADILPAGIIVLETLMEIAAMDRATATTSDLLLGYLLAQRDEAPPRTNAFHAADGRTTAPAPRT